MDLDRKLQEVRSESDMDKLAALAKNGDLVALNSMANVATAISSRQSLQQQIVTNSQLAQLNETNAQLVNIQQSIRQRTDEIAEWNRQQTQLQSQMLDVQTKQLRIQEFQANIQAANFELQNQRHEESELRRFRQKQLKDGFYSMKLQISENIKRADPLEAYLFLVRQFKEAQQVNLNPADLDEIKDKEYGTEVLELLNRNTDEALNKLSKNDVEDLINLTVAERKGESLSLAIQELRNSISTFEQKKNSLLSERDDLEKSMLNKVPMPAVYGAMGFSLLLIIINVTSLFFWLLFVASVIVWFQKPRKKRSAEEIDEDLESVDRNIFETQKQVNESENELLAVQSKMTSVLERHEGVRRLIG